MPWSPHAVTESLGRRYSRAPIVEAVFDIRVSLGDGTSVEDLAAIYADEAEAYPEHQYNFIIENEIQVNETDIGGGVRKHLNGHVYRGADGSNVFQARLDGFTFSRLHPYDCWATFSEEALRLWSKYQAVATPVAIRRLALRYINRFDFPEPRVDLGEYFKTYPELSPLLPQMLSGYFMNLQLPLTDDGAQLHLIQTIVETDSPGLSLILDLDVFYQLDVEGMSLDSIKATFDRLRDAKNGVFEACLTDAARGMID